MTWSWISLLSDMGPTLAPQYQADGGLIHAEDICEYAMARFDSIVDVSHFQNIHVSQFRLTMTLSFCRSILRDHISGIIGGCSDEKMPVQWARNSPDNDGRNWLVLDAHSIIARVARFLGILEPVSEGGFKCKPMGIDSVSLPASDAKVTVSLSVRGTAPFPAVSGYSESFAEAVDSRLSDHRASLRRFYDTSIRHLGGVL